MAWTRRYEEAEPQRVNRWLAQSGVCSRREAEDLIARGLVFIDGQRVDDERLRWVGIACFATATILRFFRKRD